MKKLTNFFAVLLFPLICFSQNYNPFVAQGIVLPAPLASVENNGTGQLSFVVGNSGSDALPLTTGQEMKVTVSLSFGVPDNADPLAAISGSFAGYFNWVYNSGINTYQGTQNQTIPGGLAGAGSVVIAYRVTNNSAKTSPQNGFNVNITPPAYTNGINTLNDDQVSSYTWTVFAVSGNVFNDLDGSTDAMVDGVGTNAGGTLYVSLVNSSNVVVSTTTVASDGTYSLPLVDDGSYTLVLHTNAAGAATASVPANWVNTGEGTTVAGEGTADGVIAITVSGANITTANFGVEQYPSTGNNTATAQANPGGSNTLLVPATTFSGSDPDGGTVEQIHILSFPTNATTIIINGISYTTGTFPPAGVYVPTNGSGNPTQTIEVDPVDGAVDVVFSYTAVDNAGMEDQTAGTATQPFLAESADLSINKTVNNASPTVGTNVIFTIVVTNNGPSTATGVVVNDLLPGGYSYVSSDVGAAYVSGTGVWTIGNLANGSTATLNITATVLASGNYTNTASVSSSTSDPDDGNNSDDATTTPGASADLSINKTVNNASPTVGTNVIFTIVVTNNGPSTATGVVVNDLLPGGYSYVSSDVGAAYVSGTGVWTIGSLANGATATLNITATVLASGNYTNTASVSSSTSDPDDGNNSDDATTTPGASADLSINKTVNNASPTVGTNVIFTIVVTNNGPSTATGVVVNDLLPGGYSYVSSDVGAAYVSGTGVWTIGNLANGSTATLNITATVLASGNYTNTASVSSSTSDPDDGNNSDDATTTPGASADLSINKTVNNASPTVGTNVIFTIVVTNNGPSTATGVVVNDLLPGGYSYVSSDVGAAYVSGTGVWTIGSLANGATATLNITATVLASGNYTNTASVSSSTNDPDDGNNSDDATTTPGASADLTINKTVNNASPTVGTNVIFTIVVTNNGPSTATGVVVNDLLPGGYSYVSSDVGAAYVSGTGVWTIGSLANGATATLNITATVLASGNYTNTASVSSSTSDPDDGNNSDDATTTPGASADLTINKTVNNASPTVGTNVIFTIVVTNNGPSTATGVVVNDLLPGGYSYVSSDVGAAYVSGTGVWTIGNLANGATATLNITATVLASGNYTNTASVSSSTSDPDDGNNSDDATTTPGASADLEVLKQVDNPYQSIGAAVQFTITVTNNGPSTATGVVVNDLLPDGFSYVSNSASQGSYVSGTGVWTVGSLSNAASATLTIQATVLSTGNYTNTATVTGSESDPDDDNNSSTTNNYTIDAVDDNGTVNGQTGGTVVANVLANDIVNGATATTGTVTISEITPASDPGVTLNTTTGEVAVAPGTAAGTYTIVYQICDAVQSGNCDQATITVTVTAGISGFVYDDADGLTGAMIIDGVGTNAGGTLYISLVDGSTVLATTAVNANGSYNFNNVAAGTYTLVLHTNPAGSTTASLPAGWANTGEGTLAAGDGTVDGSTSITISGSASANFGIDQIPVAGTTTTSTQSNPGGTGNVTIDASNFSGTDADGIISYLTITSFPSNVNTITINGTAYNAGTFPVAGVDVPTNASGQPTQTIAVDPVDGIVTVVISYTVTDNAGVASTNTGNVTIPFEEPDVTPNITASPIIMNGITNFDVTVKVTELNNVNTNGTITVLIPRDSRITFTYNAALTSVGGTAVSNANWSYDGSNLFYHVFTSTTVIPAGSFSSFGFSATFNPMNAKGLYTLTSTIVSGSGGENKTTNNNDAEKLEYFPN